MSSAIKVATEVAEAEFQRWADAMRLDLDTAGLDAEDLKSLETNKRKLLKAIQQGRLVIDDEGQAVYSPGTLGIEPLTFRKPKGDTLLALDENKADQTQRRAFSAMAVMTGTHKSLFSKLEMPDIRDCQAIAGFLLA